MIVLDTHIWIWWVHGDTSLPEDYRAYIESHESSGLGISAISCWEVAKLVELGRLQLPIPVSDWIDQALAYPGMQLIELTPQIAVESTRLPAPFHRDPADQIIVATARVFACPLITLDRKILSYLHVQHIPNAEGDAP
ncbi:MAG: type II toxin-antitoxin system VapC family toxin [Roseiflexaceae bacterium]|nr:type II toxin-antitoxin system VapC family toxin [Roseiflexaceae bacterium]